MYIGNFLESLLHEMDKNESRFIFWIGKTTFKFSIEMKNIPNGKSPAKKIQYLSAFAHLFQPLLFTNLMKC